MPCYCAYPVKALALGLMATALLGCSLSQPAPESSAGGAAAPPASVPAPLAQQGLLQTAQVTIGGVAITMDEAEIRRVLGEPTAVVDEESGCCGLLRRLEYPTLTTSLIKGDDSDPDFIYALRTDSLGVSAAGVSVGDRSEAVLSTFGPPAEDIVEADQRSLVYVVEIDADRLVFELVDDTVTSIGYYSLLN
ncbi:hypothetical protein PGN35_001950 [Nodosilinea sp. PGN35]|uniref:hypothetical protein n=1 Tax=Nodosilinea sp. PGN35 TaxID=3020489 RepID=UPI0023B297FC|nr:hypothetical protein [Nodosilinea sp. TSF1-S3]MDF0368830.1 hypothetical protein [Nodosilinea sp. TSF1-S3]